MLVVRSRYLRALLAFGVSLAFLSSVSCGTARQQASNTARAKTTQTETTLEDCVWVYSQSHPEGFTLNVRTMTEPTEGISVAYAETQDSHSKENLSQVLTHALSHDGYVGGWLEFETGLYYFDSVRLFPEDSLQAAINFGLKNKQLAIFVISTGKTIDLKPQQADSDRTPNY